MPLTMIAESLKGGGFRWVPKFVCDICHQPIDNATNAEIALNNPGDPIFVYHLDDDDHDCADRCEAEKDFLMSYDLSVFLLWLEDNIQFNRGYTMVQSAAITGLDPEQVAYREKVVERIAEALESLDGTAGGILALAQAAAANENRARGIASYRRRARYLLNISERLDARHDTALTGRAPYKIVL